LIILDAAVGDDHAARDVHARALHQPELDGIAHADVGEPGAARHRDAGDAGAQHLLHAARGLERGEFRPRGALALALDHRIAVGDVAVRVDQAGHDPLPASVDHLDGPAVLELDVLRQRAHASDPVALDDNGVVARGRPAGAVDQGAVADHQGLLARGAHDDLPVADRTIDVTSKRAASSTAIGLSREPLLGRATRRCEHEPDRLNIPRGRGMTPWQTSNTIARPRISATSSISGTSMSASATSTWRRTTTSPVSASRAIPFSTPAPATCGSMSG